MSVYAPILKGRLPSFLALENASEPVRCSIRPIIEVVPGDGDDNIKAVVQRLARQVRRHGLRDLDLAFDAAPLGQRFGGSASMEALHLLDAELGASHLTFRPVLHLDDDPHDLEEVRHLVGTHHLGVCLRVDEPYVYSLSDSRTLLEQLDAVGLPVDRADLVLDCGHLRDVREALAGLTGPLRHLRDHDWHSLTIAAGSFPGPEFFDGRPRERVLSIPRKEAALWTHVCRRWPGLGYGDYGVDHPGPPSDGLRPDPNLRYTSAGDWRFHRQPKDVKGGHGSFHRLCRSLLKSGDWPLEGPAFSWGDQQIALAACEAIGPGSGTQWKAYSMSHHFAAIVAVLDRVLPGTASAADVR
ncbi:beta family protein [Nonomuraea muscovyensis]|uniref:beta family protein n=1 Tax=Nonomuraea muscovyensis TaxID=1124761 RepID=UPI0033FD48DE